MTLIDEVRAWGVASSEHRFVSQLRLELDRSPWRDLAWQERDKVTRALGEAILLAADITRCKATPEFRLGRIPGISRKNGYVDWLIEYKCGCRTLCEVDATEKWRSLDKLVYGLTWAMKRFGCGGDARPALASCRECRSWIMDGDAPGDGRRFTSILTLPIRSARPNYGTRRSPAPQRR